MNRRSFIADMLKAGVACTFLPGAGRIWKPTYESCGTITGCPIAVPTELDLQELFRNLYAIKRARERLGIEDVLFYEAPPLGTPKGIYQQLLEA